MDYQYLKQSAANAKTWKDSHHNLWTYTTTKPERYLGDVRKVSHLQTENFLKNEKEHHQLKIEPVKQKLGLYERVRGYISCQDQAGNTVWVRIVETSKPKIWTTLLVLLALVGCTFFYVANQKKPIDDTPIKIKTNQMYNPNPENIQLPGISKIYAKSGNPDVTQLLLNIRGNDVKMQYIITLSETGEIIYKSKQIKPGYGVKAFTMNRTFEKGEYPIAIKVKSTSYDKVKKKAVAYNSGQLNATLVVR